MTNDAPDFDDEDGMPTEGLMARLRRTSTPYSGTDDGLRSTPPHLEPKTTQPTFASLFDALTANLPPAPDQVPVPEHSSLLQCFRCGRTPEQIPSLVAQAVEESEESGNSPSSPLHIYTADDIARDDGTFNPESNHFACDECYIAIGMPSSPTGWHAP